MDLVNASGNDRQERGWTKEIQLPERGVRRDTRQDERAAQCEPSNRADGQ